MEMNHYQKESRKTAKYPQEESLPLMYTALGMNGEAGEIADKIKKMLRDDGGVLTDERKESLKMELGDVMWYIAQMCTELGFTLEEVAQGNLDKLLSRMERNKINGDGDNR